MSVPILVSSSGYTNGQLFRLSSAVASFGGASDSRPTYCSFAKPVMILRLASAVSPSGFTGFDSPGVRLALLPPAVPLMRT
jgi:hypothetical protein